MKEVFEIAAMPRVAGSKVVEGTLDGCGNLDIESLVAEIDSNLRLLVNHVENGGPFDGNPLSSFAIKRHPGWDGNGCDVSHLELIDQCRCLVLEGVPAVVLESLNEMPTHIVSESLIAFVLCMVAKRAWIVSKGARRISGAKMYGDHAAAIAKSKAARVLDRCTLTPVKKSNQAAERYEIYYTILKELRRVYFGSQKKRIQRTTPSLPAWKEKKAEVKEQFPELAMVLDFVGDARSRPRELALQVVAEQLGTTIFYAERLISEGNSSLKSEG